MNKIDQLSNHDLFAELQTSFASEVASSIDVRTTEATYPVFSNPSPSQTPVAAIVLSSRPPLNLPSPQPAKVLNPPRPLPLFLSERPLDIFFSESWVRDGRKVKISGDSKVYSIASSPFTTGQKKYLQLKRCGSKENLTKELSLLTPFFHSNAEVLVFHENNYHQGKYIGYKENIHSIALSNRILNFPHQDLIAYAILPFSKPIIKSLHLIITFSSDGSWYYRLPDDCPFGVSQALSKIQSKVIEKQKKRKKIKPPVKPSQPPIPSASPAPTVTSSSTDHSATPQPLLDPLFSEPTPEVGYLPPASNDLDSEPAFKKQKDLSLFVMPAAEESDV